jgi:mannose-6-phosphate isomerase-like protein (cupin superfamily)
MKAGLEEAKRALAIGPSVLFLKQMEHGSMSVEYYKPADIDLQTPHKQDELYVIASGSGHFNKAGEIFPFETGDVLFVPAGMEHRFENYSADFATWVIFYGPIGGE